MMQNTETNFQKRKVLFLLGGLLLGVLALIMKSIKNDLVGVNEDGDSDKRTDNTLEDNPVVQIAHHPDRINHDYEVYSTDPAEYQTWVDIIFRKLKLPIPLVAIGLGLIVLLTGLAIASTIGFRLEYLSTYPIYIGAFGIVWVTGIIRHASLSFHSAYEELRPCFLVDDLTYKKVIDEWYTLLSNNKRNFIWVLGLFIAACIVVYFSFFCPNLVKFLNIESLRPGAFPSFWFTQDHIHVKALIVIWFGLCVAFPLGTAARLLVINFFFLLNLRHFPVIPLGNVVRVRLRKITNLYTFISMTWFVGVALFGIVLFENLDLLSIAALLLLSSLGTLTFLTPQVVFMNFVLRSNRIASQWTLAAFCDHLNIGLRERQILNVPTSKYFHIAKMEDLAGFVEASSQSPLWVYDPSDFILLLVGQAISLGSVFFESVVRSLV
jgi:hypothetical protein